MTISTRNWLTEKHVLPKHTVSRVSNRLNRILSQAKSHSSQNDDFYQFDQNFSNLMTVRLYCKPILKKKIMIIYVLKLQTEKIRFFNASKNVIQGVIAES